MDTSYREFLRPWVMTWYVNSSSDSESDASTTFVFACSVCFDSDPFPAARWKVLVCSCRYHPWFGLVSPCVVSDRVFRSGLYWDSFGIDENEQDMRIGFFETCRHVQKCITTVFCGFFWPIVRFLLGFIFLAFGTVSSGAVVLYGKGCLLCLLFHLIGLSGGCY